MRFVWAGAVAFLFLACGLWIGGATARVHALVRAAASSPRIAPIDGSTTESTRQVQLDGEPARLRRCIAPAQLSLAAVRDHYEDVARHEGHVRGDDDLPYVAVDQPDSAYVLWTEAQNGHRKGAIIQRSAGIVEYTLLETEAAPVDPVRHGGTVILPNGARAPEGSRPGMTLEDGGSSFTFFDAPGAPGQVVDQIEASLADAGFEVDRTSAPELDARLSQRAARGQGPRLVVPFKGNDRKGFLIVASTGPGSSRATVVVR